MIAMRHIVMAAATTCVAAGTALAQPRNVTLQPLYPSSASSFPYARSSSSPMTGLSSSMPFWRVSSQASNADPFWDRRGLVTWEDLRQYDEQYVKPWRQQMSLMPYQQAPGPQLPDTGTMPAWPSSPAPMPSSAPGTIGDACGNNVCESGEQSACPQDCTYRAFPDPLGPQPTANPQSPYLLENPSQPAMPTGPRCGNRQCEQGEATICRACVPPGCVSVPPFPTCTIGSCAFDCPNPYPYAVDSPSVDPYEPPRVGN